MLRHDPTTPEWIDDQVSFLSIVKPRPLLALIDGFKGDETAVETRLVYCRAHPHDRMPTGALSLRFHLEIWNFPLGFDTEVLRKMSPALDQWLRTQTVELGLSVVGPMLNTDGMGRKPSLLGGCMRLSFEGKLIGTSANNLFRQSNHRLIEIASRPTVELLRLPA